MRNHKAFKQRVPSIERFCNRVYTKENAAWKVACTVFILYQLVLKYHTSALCMK